MKFKTGLFDTGISGSLFNDFIGALAERGHKLFGRSGQSKLASLDLRGLAGTLLSRQGEASGTLLAETLLSRYDAATNEERNAFLLSLGLNFGPDIALVESAIARVKHERGQRAIQALHDASEPRRQELLRRLNLAPGGTAALVRMREHLMRQIAASGTARDDLTAVDADFVHLFGSWFNRGFLSVRRIDWTTPAHILDKIVRYEAVHAVTSWEDLRNRLQPGDRRCYAFFHPQLIDEPLIFVEIALTREVPASITALLDVTREPIASSEARTAVFYSICNTQSGLAGVSFGNFLIKQVVEMLRQELPRLDRFVTLSPMPGFSSWLARTNEAGLSEEGAGRLERLVALAATYLLDAKTSSGRPLDPVARFHLGNGAQLLRINADADPSPKGQEQSLGVMVNYIYDLDRIEQNHERFAEAGEIAASPEVLKIGRPVLHSAPNTALSPLPEATLRMRILEAAALIQ